VAKAGEISIYLNAYTAPFEKGLAKAQKSLAGFTAGFADINGAVEVASKAWNVFSNVAEKASAQLAKLDALADMGQRLNVSADSLQVFQRAIQLTGGEIEGLDKTLVTLRRNLGDAAMGQGGAVKAFERLGINAKQLANAGLDEAFKTAVEELSKIENPTIRAAEASDIFGKSAANLAGLLDDEGHALRQATREMKTYGVEVDKNAKIIEAAVQAEERSKLAQEKAAAQATIATSPYWEKYYGGKAFAYEAVGQVEFGKMFSDPAEFLKSYLFMFERAESKNQASRFNQKPFAARQLEDFERRFNWADLERSMELTDMRDKGVANVLPPQMQSDLFGWYDNRNALRQPFGPSAAGYGGSSDPLWRQLASVGIEGSGPRDMGMRGGVAALEFGSAGAYSAIQQSQREDESRKLQRQEVEESKKQTKELKDMNRHFQNAIILQEAGLRG
jgi:phosphoribosylformylglycinamidine (FGAM) synthase PurS component